MVEGTFSDTSVISRLTNYFILNLRPHHVPIRMSDSLKIRAVIILGGEKDNDLKLSKFHLGCSIRDKGMNLPI